jgi:hypothetical protein
MVLGSGPSKSSEFSWRRAARVLRAPRRTTPTGRGHQTGGTVSPDMMRVAWASSRFHTRMRGAAVELPVSGQTRHGSRSPAGGRAGCHERSRTGIAAGGTFPRTRCASRGLSAGPELGRAALLWCLPAAFQIRHVGLAWERSGCHERSRTGVAVGGSDPRTRCVSHGLAAGPRCSHVRG